MGIHTRCPSGHVTAATPIVVAELPFSQACENNQSYILGVLREAFAACDEVLEFASGTGQHACYFARHLPGLLWQPTELAENLDLLRPRCDAFEGANLAPPRAFDVRELPWQLTIPEAVFTANSLHIMSMAAVENLFSGLAGSPDGARLAVYGPFNYGGRYTSDSNAAFDQWLGQRNPDSAIRNFEDVNQLAMEAGFTLLEDHAMPANNRLLLWQKS